MNLGQKRRGSVSPGVYVHGTGSAREDLVGWLLEKTGNYKEIADAERHRARGDVWCSL